MKYSQSDTPNKLNRILTNFLLYGLLAMTTLAAQESAFPESLDLQITFEQDQGFNLGTMAIQPGWYQPADAVEVLPTISNDFAQILETNIYGQQLKLGGIEALQGNEESGYEQSVAAEFDLTNAAAKEIRFETLLYLERNELGIAEDFGFSFYGTTDNFIGYLIFAFSENTDEAIIGTFDSSFGYNFATTTRLQANTLYELGLTINLEQNSFNLLIDGRIVASNLEFQGPGLSSITDTVSLAPFWMPYFGEAASNNSMLLDNFSLRTNVLAAPLLNVDSRTASSIALTWDVSDYVNVEGTQHVFVIEYKPASSDAWSLADRTTESELILLDLAPSTDYDVRIQVERTTDNVTTESLQSGVYGVATRSAAGPQNLVYATGFEVSEGFVTGPVTSQDGWYEPNYSVATLPTVDAYLQPVSGNDAFGQQLKLGGLQDVQADEHYQSIAAEFDLTGTAAEEVHFSSLVYLHRDDLKTEERFAFDVYAASNLFILDFGFHFVGNSDEADIYVNNGNYFVPGVTAPANTVFEFEAILNLQQNTVDLLMDGKVLVSGLPVDLSSIDDTIGLAPAWWPRQNTANGGVFYSPDNFMLVDDFSVKTNFLATPKPNIRVTADNLVTLSWDTTHYVATADIQYSYHIEYKRASEETWNSAGSTMESTFTMTDLEPLASYDVRMRVEQISNDVSAFSFYSPAHPVMVFPSLTLPYQTAFEQDDYFSPRSAIGDHPYWSLPASATAPSPVITSAIDGYGQQLQFGGISLATAYRQLARLNVQKAYDKSEFRFSTSLLFKNNGYEGNLSDSFEWSIFDETGTAMSRFLILSRDLRNQGIFVYTKAEGWTHLGDFAIEDVLVKMEMVLDYTRNTLHIFLDDEVILNGMTLLPVEDLLLPISIGYIQFDFDGTGGSDSLSSTFLLDNIELNKNAVSTPIFNIERKTATSILLSMDNAFIAGNHFLQYRAETPDSSWIEIAYDRELSEFTLEDLVAGQTYEMRIRIEDAEGNSKYSDTLSATFNDIIFQENFAGIPEGELATNSPNWELWLPFSASGSVVAGNNVSPDYPQFNGQQLKLGGDTDASAQGIRAGLNPDTVNYSGGEIRFSTLFSITRTNLDGFDQFGLSAIFGVDVAIGFGDGSSIGDFLYMLDGIESPDWILVDGVNIESSKIYELTIVMNFDQNLAHLLLDNKIVVENLPLFRFAKWPGQSVIDSIGFSWFSDQSGDSGNYMLVDDVKVQWYRKPASYLTWLNDFDASVVHDGMLMASDPDGDGVSLLMEYALGMDPVAPSVFNLPKVELDPIGKQLQLVYTPAIQDGLEYRVESSNDLRNWTDAGVTQGINFGSVSLQASEPVFLRLAVGLQENND